MQHTGTVWVVGSGQGERDVRNPLPHNSRRHSSRRRIHRNSRPQPSCELTYVVTS